MSQVTPFAGWLGTLFIIKKMCSNNITKQKLIFNVSSDYKFWANIMYTVILENVLSVDMKNSWNRPKSPRFGYLYIPNITAKYCHFIYPSDIVTLLRVC